MIMEPELGGGVKLAVALAVVVHFQTQHGETIIPERTTPRVDARRDHQNVRCVLLRVLQNQHLHARAQLHAEAEYTQIRSRGDRLGQTILTLILEDQLEAVQFARGRESIALDGRVPGAGNEDSFTFDYLGAVRTSLDERTTEVVIEIQQVNAKQAIRVLVSVEIERRASYRYWNQAPFLQRGEHIGRGGSP